MTTGEILAEELQTRILQIKVNAIVNKLEQYYNDLNQVDIPDFMKPEDQQISTFIRRSINRMYITGTIDHFYNLAISEVN